MAQALGKGSVVAVIGSGAMGAGIAQVAAASGYQVKLFDTRPGAVDDEALMTEAMAMATHFATAPTKGLGFTKKALQASYANTLPDQLKLERDMMRELGNSHDYREGVAAFVAKRPAQFKGE